MLDQKKKEDRMHQFSVRRDPSRKREDKKAKRKSKSPRRRNRSPSSESLRSDSSRRRSRGREEKKHEDRTSHHSHSHSHAHQLGSEETDDTYIDVPFEAFLLKKNFDYILLDKEDLVEYTGKSDIKINQMLRVPYHGSLQLASHFISQMYRDSRFETKREEEFIIVAAAHQINESIMIFKEDHSNCLLFKWNASEKNDIIADCLAYFFSQFPDNNQFDLFNSSAALPSRAAEVFPRKRTRAAAEQSDQAHPQPLPRSHLPARPPAHRLQRRRPELQSEPQERQSRVRRPCPRAAGLASHQQLVPEVIRL